MHLPEIDGGGGERGGESWGIDAVFADQSKLEESFGFFSSSWFFEPVGKKKTYRVRMAGPGRVSPCMLKGEFCLKASEHCSCRRGM